MYEELKGKKLLILGASANEITLVQRAKELGLYTIITDYNLDRKLSPAKNYADEVWDISWSDIDRLEQLSRAAGVAGVVAGYSEFRVENQIKLCKRLGLPCCTTEEQLDITRNKDKFKESCRRNKVPVVRDYASPQEVTHFPVIVKPVDRGGSIGISVANDKKELDTAYRYAMDCSVCKKVIIEDFVTDGVKVDFYYSVCDGEVYYLSANDVIFASGNGNEKVIQSAWPYHSRYEKEYLETIDSHVRDMIRDIGVKDGYMFFSSFWTPRGFVFFEMGQRMCGGHTYAFFPKEGRTNNLDLYILHAVTGSTKCLQFDEAKACNQHTVTINVYANAGTVRTIEGIAEIEKMPDCALALQYGHIGQVCEDDKAILAKLGMFIFTNPDPKALSRDVRQLYEVLKITGENGEDMIFDRIDPDAIAAWWS